MNVSDISISQCWIDTQYGDTIRMLTYGDMCVKHINISNRINIGYGEDICVEYGNFECALAFVNAYNLTLLCVQSVADSKRARKDSYTLP